MTLLDHHTRFEVGRGQHDRDAVHIGEAPQYRHLVRNTVLRREDCGVRGGVRGEIVESGTGLMALDREDHDGFVAPVDLAGVGRGRKRHGALTGLRHQFEPAGPDGTQVVPTGDRGHVETSES